jgi:hypothetical protein
VDEDEGEQEWMRMTHLGQVDLRLEARRKGGNKALARVLEGGEAA